VKKTIAGLFLLALLMPLAAQPASPNPALDDAVLAIQMMNHNLGRWFIVVIVALVLFALVSAWRIWGYSRRLVELDELRSSTERRLSELTDELLRLRTKVVSIGDHLDRCEKDMTLLKPEGAADLSAQLARLDEEIARLPTRLDEELREVRLQLEDCRAKIAALAQAEPPKAEIPTEVFDATAAAHAAQEAAAQASQRADEAATLALEAASRAEAAVLKTEDDIRRQIAELREQIAEKESRGRGVEDSSEERAAEPAVIQPEVEATPAPEPEPETELEQAEENEPEQEEREQEPAAAEVRSKIAEARAQSEEPEADFAAAGDERLAAGEYGEAIDLYTQWVEQNEAGPDRKTLFSVLHNRAVANVRLGRYMDALNDAAALEPLTDVSPKAAGAARVLSGIVHLNQGLVDEALEDFGQALVIDPSARKALARDEDVEAWLSQNPADAKKVRRELDKLLGREKPKAEAQKPKVKSQEPKAKGQEPKAKSQKSKPASRKRR
jgi:tetratricopeptide (TPR) repeat protein